jgi:transcriptional regulator with XRE-family HTH domain
MVWHEGDVIRKLRASVNWTLRDLASVSGVNVQVIHRLESGQTRDPKTATLERLAEAFGITARDLRSAVPLPSPVVIRPKRLRRRPAKPTDPSLAAGTGT